MTKPTILTGLRANSDLTIGNYFGGLQPIIKMALEKSDDYQINLFVPDLHSFTTPIDHTKLQEQIAQNVRMFVAAGLPIDHDDVHIYRQSRISAHSELTWILDCFAGFGELSRMTEFKDKSQRLGTDHIGVGQFNYPVLMAADILLYNTAFVPVGEDQRQHIEFTRTIAERLNNKFGELVTLPASMKEQAVFFGNQNGESLRVMDLQDPSKKMSKSDESDKGVIYLNDEPALAAKKIMSAATDDNANVQFDPISQPGVSNLLTLLSLTTDNDMPTILQSHAGQNSYGDFKITVAQAISEFLTDFQMKLSNIDQQVIDQKLENSEIAMAKTANETLLRVQKAVGLR